MKTDFENEYGRLTEDLLVSIINSHKGKNVVFSPLSALCLLELMQVSASGETRREIADVLPSSASSEEQIGMLKEFSDGVQGRALHLASAVFASDSYQESFHKEYLKRIRETFNAELFCGNDSMDRINIWADEQSGALISNVVDDKPAGPAINLINVISFSSYWEDLYEKLREGTFHNADLTNNKVKFLCSDERKYVSDGFFVGFIKPYRDDFEFMALLPKKKENAFLNGALEALNWQNLYRSMIAARVKTMMPAFSIGFNTELTNFFESKGIHNAFTPEADFSSMTSMPAWLSSVSQKAVIQVDNYGTKAAAASVGRLMGAVPLDDGNIYSVKLDRPFLFAIVQCRTGMPVFTGMVNKVKEQHLQDPRKQFEDESDGFKIMKFSK